MALLSAAHPMRRIENGSLAARASLLMSSGWGTEFDGDGHGELADDTTNVWKTACGRRLTVTTDVQPFSSFYMRNMNISPALNITNEYAMMHVNLYIGSSRTYGAGASQVFTLHIGYSADASTFASYRSYNLYLSNSSSTADILDTDCGRFYTLSVPVWRYALSGGTFDPTQINALRFTVNTGSTMTQNDYITLDSIYFTERQHVDGGALVIHCDDFRKTIVDNAISVANTYGVKLTFPIVQDTLGATLDANDIGTAADLAAAVRQGHGVMCHPNGGTLVGYTQAEQLAYLKASQDYLLNFANQYGADIGDGWRHITTHTGAHNGNTTAVLPMRFDTACTRRCASAVGTTTDVYANAFPQDPLSLRRFPFENAETTANIRTELESVIANDLVVIWYLHDISDAHSITVAEWTQICSDIATLGIPTWTQEQLGHYMLNGSPFKASCAQYLGWGRNSAPSATARGRYN